MLNLFLQGFAPCLKYLNKIFKILAKNVSRENCYVKSVKLNGVALEKPFINHKDIMKGGVIEFTMTDKPTKWGVIAEK